MPLGRPQQRPSPPEHDEVVSYYEKHPKHILQSTDPEHRFFKYTYTDHVNSNGPWNRITIFCRGIIYDDRGRLVHWPFNKFFNYGQILAPSYQTITTAEMYWFTVKYDGVLILPFKSDTEIVITSRGGFENEFIAKSRAIAAERYNGLNHLEYENYWHMFELISPEYSQREGFLITEYPDDDLVLVGLREKRTGRLMDPEVMSAYARRHELRATEVVYDCLDNILDARERRTGATDEGWVLFLPDSTICKIKRQDYLTILHQQLAEKYHG